MNNHDASLGQGGISIVTEQSGDIASTKYKNIPMYEWESLSQNKRRKKERELFSTTHIKIYTNTVFTYHKGSHIMSWLETIQYLQH